jgi:hypothetical protein
LIPEASLAEIAAGGGLSLEPHPCGAQPPTLHPELAHRLRSTI